MPASTASPGAVPPACSKCSDEDPSGREDRIRAARPATHGVRPGRRRRRCWRRRGLTIAPGTLEEPTSFDGAAPTLRMLLGGLLTGTPLAVGTRALDSASGIASSEELSQLGDGAHETLNLRSVSLVALRRILADFSELLPAPRSPSTAPGSRDRCQIRRRRGGQARRCRAARRSAGKSSRLKVTIACAPARIAAASTCRSSTSGRTSASMRDLEVGHHAV